MTMGVIKKWITDTLSTDTEFKTLCTSTIGNPLNLYRSSPMDRIVETMPFLTVFSDTLNEDYSDRVEYGETLEVPIAIGIEAVETSVADGETTLWESTDKVELIAKSAVNSLRFQARSCGIGGEDVIILSARIIVSEIGEADDVQANVFLTFGKLNHI